ncbi:flagellar basal body P-ring formation chaperone FlgA [Hydrogenimonas urashimensis]|uniref:flagellar basal body P-ring formation chaperone FlgA n=1 Tax=Hydrogenimonas urashimensis TaxID=2740515 RepID=UPI00191667D3|nr:flagellar basal body P-ring formation chaperone FlgA [Hydrogenimonas urashimensis]
MKRLPKERFRWQIPVYEIKTLLEKEGHRVRLPKSGIITFERSFIGRYPALEKEVAGKFRRHYPAIEIKSITVKPTGLKYSAFEFSKKCTLRLSEGALGRNHGTFVVKCGKKNHFFQFRIDAQLGVYKANHQIKKDRIIDLNSLRYENIPLVRMHDTPVTDLSGGRYMARQIIPADKIITARMVAPIPAVKKDERVLCIYQEGNVRIEFEATALQNGYMGNSVTVKKSDGKSIRGVVTGEKKVEIR